MDSMTVPVASASPTTSPALLEGSLSWRAERTTCTAGVRLLPVNRARMAAVRPAADRMLPGYGQITTATYDTATYDTAMHDTAMHQSMTKSAFGGIVFIDFKDAFPGIRGSRPPV